MPAPRSTLDWLLEAIALATLLLMLGVVVQHWAELPDQIPRHFNAAGDPDRWGPKSGIWVLPIVATASYLALTVLSGFPERFNVPFRLDRNKPEVLSLLRKLLMTVKIAMLLTFAYLSWVSISTALGHTSGLGKGFLPLATAGAFAPVVYYLEKLRRYRQ